MLDYILGYILYMLLYAIYWVIYFICCSIYCMAASARDLSVGLCRGNVVLCAASVSHLMRAVALSWQKWPYQLVMFPKGCVFCFRIRDFWSLLFAQFFHSPYCITHVHTHPRTDILSMLCMNSLSGCVGAIVCCTSAVCRLWLT